MLEQFFKREYATWEYVHDEYEFIDDYNDSWSNSPYPPVFVTADALVQQGNYVLLIKRKNCPGKDTWALPGGYINQYESILDGMVRELREETGLKLPVPVIKGSIINYEYY